MTIGYGLIGLKLLGMLCPTCRDPLTTKKECKPAKGVLCAWCCACS